MNSRLSKLIFFIIPIFTIGIFSLLINLRMVPITEGWWETYAWLSESSTIYKDFYLALPPLYIKIIGLMLGINDNLLSIRYLMLIIYLINIIFIYYLCKVITKSDFSILGVFVAEILIITKNPVWLSKDYHTLVSLLTCIFCISIFFYIKYANSKKANLLLLAMGFISALICLTKQNIALVCIISSLITIIWLNRITVRSLKQVIIYFTFIGITLGIYSYLNGWGWLSVYQGNDSKGNAATVFLRILRDPAIRYLTIRAILVSILALLIYSLINKNADLIQRSSENLKRLCKDYLLLNNKIIGYILFFIALKLILVDDDNFYFYVLMLGFYISLILILIFKTDKFKNFSIFCVTLIMLAYAGTMTAGYNNVSLELLIALFSTIVFDYLIKKFNLNKIFALFLLVLVSAGLFYKNKVNQDAYNWWGYSTDSLLNSSYNSDIPKLNGLKLDFETQEILRETSHAIANISDSDSIFTYPSIPMFYWIYDKKPIVHNIVQWFDVFPSNNTDQLINDLSVQNPKLIFWLKPGDDVYQGHYLMKRSALPMVSIDKFLLDKIDSGEYKITTTIPIIHGGNHESALHFRAFLKSPVEYDFICKTCGSEDFDVMIKDGTILNYFKSPDLVKGQYYKINFSNKYDAALFIKKHNLIPINQKEYIFYVLKRQ